MSTIIQMYKETLGLQERIPGLGGLEALLMVPWKAPMSHSVPEGKDTCRGRRNPFNLREMFQDQERHVNINHIGRASQFKCWWTATNGRHSCRRFLTPFQTALPFRPVGSGGQYLIRREWRTIRSSRQYYLFVKLSFLLSPSTLGMSSFYSSL